ncbi:DNA-binding PadR family transcriptional regulator [Diaminobutyricimonas aerilata]|uniref:DNA-binding PadR family transcriptional regulator n=1 Tax=Diaminobutyricimonas aerilata TaxID=1162967 RepID=A0A2M9CNI8_9MICO|nr:PadR family transcriptional regulator [Diaminobutyricimonas aerilata]PJJ73460.1 DNA-binding PadR family transcriptional regulator [Diaminobutyricimonas aerilata]
MSPAVFGHGHLRLYLLSLLEERPRHGYELIQALGDRFGGTYVPSAGTIYPRLSKLEAEGLVTKQNDGRKTVYEITDAGRAELAARRHELDGIESEVTDSVRRLADEVRASVDGAMRSLRAELAAAARETRSATPPPPPPPAPHAAGASSSNTRLDSRLRLSEAEQAIAHFRQQLRSDLRGHAARGELSRETVDVLRTGLGDLRAAVTATLRVGSADGAPGAAAEHDVLDDDTGAA